jgi:restriction system protein
MARSFTSVLISAARASARASRRYETNQRKEASAQQRYARALEKDGLRLEKENVKRAKQEYLELRLKEADELTKEDNKLFDYLNCGIIKETLEIDDTVNFESLKPNYAPPSIEVPQEVSILPAEPSEEYFIKQVGNLPILGHLFSSTKRKWNEKVENAKLEFKSAHKNWELKANKKKKEIEEFKGKLEIEKNQYEIDFNRKCNEVEEFKATYLAGDEESIASYVGIVIENSDYLFDWERNFKTAFNKDSGELIIEFQLPTIDIIPDKCEYKYVKSKDVIDEKPRKKAELDSCYKNLISSIAIRTIHEICESDQSNFIQVIIFNGYVETIDKGNGKTIFPMLLSISVSKQIFNDINLDKIDTLKCIQNLSAKISSSPSSLVPIKPVKDFSMVDKRYVDEIDIISSMDNRPNLMELNPFEFENLVTNLFSKMGLETKQTRSSRDGGIDAVAFDLRPVLGGKIVIQAKRYKNVVGVSAVRDLYGTMINEGATKGILVTTSWYGPDAYEFSKDKPIELIDGSGLLYLLHEIGTEARIIMPID